MDFAFSEEQQMLRSQARELLAGRVSTERIAKMADSDTYWDESVHKELASLGWIGLSSPESAGGGGTTFIEEAVLFEELGSALYAGPYFSTVALAQPALERLPEVLARVAAGEATGTLAAAEAGSGPTASLADTDSLGTVARADGDSWRIGGTKVLVPDAAIVSDLVVTARGPDGVGIFHVAASEAEITEASTMDSTRRLGTVRFDNAPGALIAAGAEAETLLEKIRVRSLAAAALESVGLAQRLLELATEYVKERKQFDRPIGVYQAVSHQVADIYVETELARSLAYWAAWSVAEEEQAALAASTAKAFAAEAAVAAAERCIQVHGGIGFTWEHIAHRYYKRAQWLLAFEGSSAAHRARVAEQLPA